ncbi:MAG: hypothetical protein KF745_06080 [Phycisphaeraceae bacterium]|nr:hypothetical protein [Phycisphaeraceae bacterium]
MVRIGVLCAVLVAAVVTSLTPVASATLPPYSPVGSFALPSSGPFDLLPDGRVVRLDGSDVWVQQAVNSSAYTRVGSVAPGVISSFGASFARISPDGQTLAIGDNNFGPGANVLLVAMSSLHTGVPTTPVAVASPNQEAAWSGNGSLYVSGFGAAPVVSRIDVPSLSATTVISGSGAWGASGGVAIADGRLYTSDGFNTAAGGAPTGNIRAFALSLLVGGTPVDFATGILVADALSGASLGFDAGGHLLVGGGDFFSGSDDFGYAAVIDSDAILAALAGGPVAPDASELRLSPAGSGAYYATQFNPVTGELLVVADGTAYRYAVPAPPAVFGLLAGFAALSTRRRRHA